MRRIVPVGLILASAFALTGCETLSYHWQATRGHLALMHARVDIQKLLDNSDLPPAQRTRLLHVLDAREFAATTLQLPRNASYSTVALLDRDAVVYNVVAAPEFSLQPHRWCFPIAGCVSYRGYFALSDAQAKAEEMADLGYDTVITRAAAYSTLGWFADPLPSPVLRWRIADIIELIFHELAHQKLYVEDDTRFNESYASAVGALGLEAWRQTQPPDPALNPAENLRAEVYALLQPVLSALQALYEGPLSTAEKRLQKAELLQSAALEAMPIRERAPGWDRWFEDLNNARLAGLSDYSSGVQAFRALFDQCAQDWDCFHRRSADIGADAQQRRVFLQQAAPTAPAPTAD